MIRAFCQKVTAHKSFERFVVAVILINGVILGLETSADIYAKYGDWLQMGNHLVLTIFILEAIIKITAVAPQWKRYFGDGWNLFDFTVVVLSLIPFTGDLAMVARLLRLLRVLRLISAIPELRMIVSTLMRSIPSMGNVLLLMSIIFYIYAVAGYHLFHAHDPEHWSTLGLSLLTLFRIVTLEDWTDVMYTAMEMHPLAWIYFVSFVIMGTFVIINLFIAVVLNNLDEAKAERMEQLLPPVSHKELLRELRQTQESLERLHQRIEAQEKARPDG